ncbi:MAG TPA: hypothetical protein VJQ47_13580 [Steroidobacteraceae bacterium]|nr:hypothetical protein [Steroidobacteraceae bacterium]
MPARTTIYLLVNIAFMLGVAVATAVQGSGGTSLLYLIALFGLCSAPLLSLRSLNGRYALLAVFMAFYFLFFGMMDFLAVLSGAPAPDAVDDPATVEFAILVGAVCALGGYHITAATAGGTQRSQLVDWPKVFILSVGLALWLIGSSSLIYSQVYVIPEKTNMAAQRGYAELGAALTFIVMLGNMVAPLGLLILSYGYAKFRTRFWLVLILGMLAAQVVLAFVTDIRGQAIIPPGFVIVALTLKDGKLPKAWLVGALLTLPAIYPILTAYRVEITGGRGLSREQAVNNLGKVVDIVLGSVKSGKGEENQASIFERASLKGNVEIAFAHTGVDRPFQEGHTLLAIPLAFIPRIIWPSKPDVQTGQLFNHEFFPGGVADTYISPSHFGELYWNFGWPGIIVGMLLIGMLLGFVGAKTDLEQRPSVTRVLILLATVQYLCTGFEGAMSISYVLWLRSLAAIGLLHLLFTRAAKPEHRSGPVATTTPVAVAGPRFPNLLH